MQQPRRLSLIIFRVSRGAVPSVAETQRKTATTRLTSPTPLVKRKREKQGSCPAVRKNKLAQTWPCRAAIHAVLGTTWQASHTETGVHGHPCLAIGCPNTLVHFTCAELVQLSFLPHLAGRTSWASIQPCSLHHTSQIPIKPKTTFQT